MKKVFFIAIMATMFALIANAQETTKTVIISNFTSRAVAVEMPLFYQMAVGEAKGYSFVQADTNGKMTGFISIVSTTDAEEKAPCIKIRIANGKDMTILSFFNGWAKEIVKNFTDNGYTVSENDETVTITKGDNKITLNKADFATAKVTATEVVGWQSF